MSSTGDRRNERLIAGLLVAVLLAGSLLVLMPFMTALLWAIVLSFSSWPLYRRASALLGGRRTVATLLMTLATTLILLVPLLVVGLRVADNAQELAVATRQRMERGLPAPPAWVARIPLVGDRAYAYWESVALDGKRFTDTLEPYVRPVFASLMVGGKPSITVTSARHSCAPAMPSASRRRSSRIPWRRPGESVRIVPRNSARSGITLCALPASSSTWPP
jgi:predicted PurR-regulated permease PerM